MKKTKLRFAIVAFALLCVVFASACGAGAPGDSTDADAADLSVQSGQTDDSGDDAGAIVGSIARTGDEGGGAVINGGSSDNKNSSGNSGERGGDTGPGGVTEPAPLSMSDDMGIRISGQWFPIWQDASALLRALGDDYELSAAASCVFDGEDKEFAYDGCFVFTNPNGDRDIWYSILLESDAFPTARGVRVGNSVEEVMDAYGDRYYWEGADILTYSISGEEGDIASPCILFTLADGCVSTIEIYYPTNVT